MSPPQNQPKHHQSDDAESSDPSPNQPPPASPEPESTGGEEQEEEEGECGFCLFMKGGGCKDTFINWENCVKEAEEKSQDLVEKCSEVTAKLKQCMDSHSDYYEPILRAEKHAEEQVAIELEIEKQDLEAMPTPTTEDEKEQSNSEAEKPSDQPAPEAPRGGGCKDTFIDWENCVKEAEDKSEDLVEKCSEVTARLKQCIDAHSGYCEPILRAEKHAEEQVAIELEKEKHDSEASNNQREASSQSNQK